MANMEFKQVYKVVGKQRGSFKDKESGQDVNFCSVFTAQPIVFPDASNATFSGVKTDKHKANDRVFDKVVLGGCYEFFFDKHGRVVMVDDAPDFDSSGLPF